MGTLEPTNIPAAILPETKAQIENLVWRTFYKTSSYLPEGVIEYTSATMGWDDQLNINIQRPNHRNFYVKRIHLVIIRATNSNLRTWGRLADWLDKDDIAYKITYREGFSIYRPSSVYHNGRTQSATSHRLMKSFIRERRWNLQRSLERITERSNKRAWDALKAAERIINLAESRLEVTTLTLVL